MVLLLSLNFQSRKKSDGRRFFNGNLPLTKLFKLFILTLSHLTIINDFSQFKFHHSFKFDSLNICLFLDTKFEANSGWQFPQPSSCFNQFIDLLR